MHSPLVMLRSLLQSTIAAAAIAHAGAAAAQGWHHAGPVTSGDVKAYVDFQVRDSVPAGDVWQGGTPQGPASYRSEADPLWVNVHRADLRESDHVHVQLISYVRSCYRGECADTQEISERDLDFAEPGRFTGRLPGVTLGYQLNDGHALTSRTQYAAELVIWVDGVLYKGADGRNLRLDMQARSPF